MERSRAHFAYAKRYLDVGDRGSIAKAIAHFGRGMAYGSHAEKILSNLGPYTYHWKLNGGKYRVGKGHYATIDVIIWNPKGRHLNVATITVYDHSEGGFTSPKNFSVALGERDSPSDLRSRYMAREVASVIRKLHQGDAGLIKTRNLSIPVDPILVTFDDSWGHGFDPLEDSIAWELVEGAFKSGGCWPRLGGGSENKENQISVGSITGAMRDLALRGAGYNPLQEIASRSPSALVLTTFVYTNGGVFYRVKQFEDKRFEVEVLTDKGCKIAFLEFAVKDSSKAGPLVEIVNAASAKAEAGPHQLAYVRLACFSLIRFLYESPRIISSSPEKDDVAQWYVREERPTVAKKKPVSGSSKPVNMR